MNKVLMIIMAAGAVLGGVDRLRGNKWGYGEKFEAGFMLLGSMGLSMAGMICVAPVLADTIGRIIVPVYRIMGVDPAMFGSVLAIDMGGYGLAKELATDAQTGSYAGLVVSAIFGCTVVFTIPVGMGMIEKDDREYFARGIMMGLAAMPVGLTAGGLLSGLSFIGCLRQNMPVFVLALLLLIGLIKFPNGMIKCFCLFAEGIRWLATVGLVLAAVEFMTGRNPVPGMVPIEEAMSVVTSIGVVLLGSLPAAEFLQRRLARPFARLGEMFGMNSQSLTGMFVGMVSALPTLTMYRDMNSRGKVVTASFLVSGTSMLAAHMAFVLSTEPKMLLPLMAGKFIGAVSAAALTVMLYGRLFSHQSNFSN